MPGAENDFESEIFPLDHRVQTNEKSLAKSSNSRSVGQKSYARLPRQSNGADNPYLIMSDQPAAQSMARQKARCLIFNGYVWRWQAPRAPPSTPSIPTSSTQPPPAPIVCTLLPLYSPLLSPPLVTIHNDYFAHRARGLPFQIIPSKLEVAPPLSKMSEWVSGYPLDCYDY